MFKEESATGRLQNRDLQIEKSLAFKDPKEESFPEPERWQGRPLFAVSSAGIFVLILLHPLLALAKMADCGTFFGCLGEESYYQVNCEA